MKKFLATLILFINFCHGVSYGQDLNSLYSVRNKIIFQTSKFALVNEGGGILIYDKILNKWTLPTKYYGACEKPMLRKNLLYIQVAMAGLNSNCGSSTQDFISNIMIYNLDNYSYKVSRNIDNWSGDCYTMAGFTKDGYLVLKNSDKAATLMVDSSANCYKATNYSELSKGDKFYDWSCDDTITVITNKNLSPLTINDNRYNKSYIFTDNYILNPAFRGEWSPTLYGKYWPPEHSINSYFPLKITSNSKTIYKGNGIYIGSSKDYLFYSEEFPYDSIEHLQGNLSDNTYLQNFKSFIVAVDRATGKQYIIKFTDKYVNDSGIFSIENKIFYYDDMKMEQNYMSIEQYKPSEIPQTFCTMDTSDKTFQYNKIAEYPQYKVSVYENGVWVNNQKIYSSRCIIDSSISNGKLNITDFKGKFIDKISFNLKDHSIASAKTTLSKISFFNSFNY